MRIGLKFDVLMLQLMEIWRRTLAPESDLIRHLRPAVIQLTVTRVAGNAVTGTVQFVQLLQPYTSSEDTKQSKTISERQHSVS